MADIPVPAGKPETLDEASVLRRVGWRLLPFLFLLYVINILDRTNIGIAKLTMLDDLEMSEQAYGWGAGLFYVGYLLFEVPSNLILERVGARRWIARILISWGLVSTCMMFVTGPASFYFLRVLLGVAEAGFFPGIILYLSQWFPSQSRGKAVARFMAAGLFASMIGNPISGAILEFMKGVGGLAGWQWVFLLEGIPAVALGFVTYRFLTDRPEQATWLTPAERTWLATRMAEEKQALGPPDQHTLRAAMTNPYVWLLIGVYFSVAVGDNSFGFFLPTLLKAHFPSWGPASIGMLAAVPSVAAVIAMNLVGMHSDATNERRKHVAASALAAACGWTIVAFSANPITGLIGLTITLCGMKSMLPTFWAIPPTFLTGTAAAGGIALINSVANLGGLFGPVLMGQLKRPDGSFTVSMLVVAAILLAGAILVLQLPKTQRRAPIPADAMDQP